MMLAARQTTRMHQRAVTGPFLLLAGASLNEKMPIAQEEMDFCCYINDSN
jgi:hypothetical protein